MQNLIFTNTIAASHADPNYCGPMIYTLSPTSGFLSISGINMILATTNVADVGLHPLSLTIAMEPATSTTLKYSDSAVNLTFATIQTPACGKSVSFAISPTKTFLSLMNPTASGGSVQISGATYTDIGN